ncbi:Protein kinase domain-containing protein [Mycena kentingensis (nom. inval.)]|nr:Protein kinase domain-containing protein [Mycena kentingensis (nom. inval.)]
MSYRQMNLTFLGTCSGGGPSDTRNCSSLVLDVLGRGGPLWMVDCAEGTVRQFAFQPENWTFKLRPNAVRKLFITHMHADHTMGIIPLLRNILYPPPVTAAAAAQFPRSDLPRIEIFGPAGIRRFVRTILKMTLTNTADKYVVHELLTADDEVTTCDPDEMHSSEVPGQDVRCSEDGFWRGFTSGQSQGHLGDIVVDAGPILHRDPCIGYVFNETDASQRQIVVLGDTYDASGIVPLCKNPSLVVHEATDCYIPLHIQPTQKRSSEVVEQSALSRGHSIPRVAGEFAKAVGAERLIMNHIGGRFPAPRHDRDPRQQVIREIERQATEAWASPGRQAQAAWDFMRVSVNESRDRARPHSNSNSQVLATEEFPPLTGNAQAPPQPAYADPGEGLLYVNKKRKW